MLRHLRALFSGLALLALLAVSGCSTNDAAAEGGDSSSDAQFPVSIEHVFGTTEIPDKPQRVVTMGWITQDVVAALGVAPVGVPTSWGGDEEGLTPWFRTQVEDVLGAQAPEVLSEDEEPDYEQILSLKPDVILAPHSGVTETQYKRLTEIAPTVAYAEQPWTSGSWQELTQTVGTALGETEKAEELIASTEKTMEESVAKHPNLKDTNFLYGLSLTEGSTEAGFYISADPRVAFLRQFGLTDSPSLKDALGSIEDDAFYGASSLEKLDSLKTDIFVGWSNSPEETKYTLEHPAFSRWKPIADGNYYFIEDATMGMATNGPSPLSIAWAIDEGFVDDLSGAVDGKAVVRKAP